MMNFGNYSDLTYHTTTKHIYVLNRSW